MFLIAAQHTLTHEMSGMVLFASEVSAQKSINISPELTFCHVVFVVRNFDGQCLERCREIHRFGF
jgi:hypothetical protein